MADLFTLAGSYQTQPQVGSPSAIPSVVASVLESFGITFKHVDEIALTVDTPVSVSFGGVTDAHVVVLKSVGGKVRARLTSADGATQAVPVNTLFILICRDNPITAVDLTRVAGQATSVSVFLGQIS